MTMLANRHLTVSALLSIAAAMHVAARRVRAGARRLHAWIERRDADADARDALRSMSEHELFDIGLTRLHLDGRGATPYERVPHWNGGLLRASGAPAASERAVVLRSSAWLHSGFVCALVCAGGVAHTIHGDGTWLSSFAMVAAGGVLAIESWRRGRAALNPED